MDKKLGKNLIMSIGYNLLTMIVPFITAPFCNWKDIKPHLKPTLLLFIPTIAVSIYQTMDKIMIGAIDSESELAYYEYAEKITSGSING